MIEILSHLKNLIDFTKQGLFLERISFRDT